MTSIATDIVDVYVFRRLNARVQFLLLQRRNDVPMARTWQAFHHEIAADQSAPDAANAALSSLAGLTIDRFYSADYINQFYDEARDAVVLAPVLAVTINDPASLTLAEEFQDAGWFDRDEATARLPFSGQRWAVRHIDEIMGIGESEAELYRFDPSSLSDAEPRELQPVPATNGEETDTDDIGLEPPAEGTVDEAQARPADADSEFDTPSEPAYRHEQRQD